MTWRVPGEKPGTFSFAAYSNVALALPDEDDQLDACISCHVFTRAEQLDLEMTAFAQGRMALANLAGKLKPSA